MGFQPRYWRCLSAMGLDWLGGHPQLPDVTLSGRHFTGADAYVILAELLSCYATDYLFDSCQLPCPFPLLYIFPGCQGRPGVIPGSLFTD